MVTKKPRNYPSYSNPPRLAIFVCTECHTSFPFKIDKEDPLSSSGCCKVCGSSKWQIKNLAGGIIE